MNIDELAAWLRERDVALNARYQGENGYIVSLISSRHCVTQWGDTFAAALELAVVEWDSSWSAPPRWSKTS